MAVDNINRFFNKNRNKICNVKKSGLILKNTKKKIGFVLHVLIFVFLVWMFWWDDTKRKKGKRLKKQSKACW